MLLRYQEPERYAELAPVELTVRAGGEEVVDLAAITDLAADANRLRPLIDECHALGVRVSLFMDAEPVAMAAARAVGADRVELYTEPYAAAYATAQRDAQLQRFAAAASVAVQAGLQSVAVPEFDFDLAFSLTP